MIQSFAELFLQSAYYLAQQFLWLAASTRTNFYVFNPNLLVCVKSILVTITKDPSNFQRIFYFEKDEGKQTNL